MYGCELWNMRDEKKAVRELCVAYHSCLKKLVRVPRWSRNHDLCNELSLLTCPMLVAYRQLLFWLRIKASENSIVLGLGSSCIGEVGLLARSHLFIRTQYELVDLDLYSVNKADLRRVFAAHLERFVLHRLENNPGTSAVAADLPPDG